MLIKTHRKILKTSSLAYTMLLVPGRISPKNKLAFYVPIGCVMLARYCGKMYNHYLFPYRTLTDDAKCLSVAEVCDSSDYSVFYLLHKDKKIFTIYNITLLFVKKSVLFYQTKTKYNHAQKRDFFASVYYYHVIHLRISL